jgi:hypothetical protein
MILFKQCYLYKFRRHPLKTINKSNGSESLFREVVRKKLDQPMLKRADVRLL